MKKITVLIFLFFSISNTFSQLLYNREWTKANVGVHFCTVKPSTEELFFHGGNYIYSFNKNNSTNSLFYNFPIPNASLIYAVLIENMKFDSSENLIVYGRTHNPDLGTSGVYSKTPIVTNLPGYTFIAKISRNGQLLWFTYFHYMVLHASSLAIDKNDNIYVLNLRDKTDVLSPTNFQSSGDMSSNINSQEVISKLDASGKHVWSTFYFKDDSNIRNIIAGDNGLYIYGDHLGGTTSSNYFGTTGSHQEYSSGLTSNGNSSTVFISKFNFNGSRIWSSYFGEQISKCPINNSNFPYGMTVIGDEAYILTDLINISTPAKNVATSNAYLTTPISTFKNTTLTKFTGNGKLSFTTYLNSGQAIQKTNSNDLFITGEIPNTNTNLSSLTTQNAYQKQHGGKSDVYTYVLSNNGSTLKYGSFYGYDGTDLGIAVTTTSGYYVFGKSLGNSSATTLFDTNGGKFNGSNNIGYSGNFISYFTTKPLSNHLFDKLNVNIYPNPTTDILNIQSKDVLSENTTFTVYDISGKKVLIQKTQTTELNQLNVSNLSSGVYILQIDNSNINQSFKFIKK